MGLIFCVPEVRSQFGFGHLARQCVLVNYLRQCGKEAFIALPESVLADPSKMVWLSNRIQCEYLIPCATVKSQALAIATTDTVIIDSYDVHHTAGTIGRNPLVDLLTVFDDLAYERDYPKNIKPVIPNICGSEQLKKIVACYRNDFPEFAFGPDHVLIHPAFVLPEQDRKNLLTVRRSRIVACQLSETPVVVLLGFGGSISTSSKPTVSENVLRFLESLKSSCYKIEVRCVGPVPEALTAVTGISTQSLSWMGVEALAQEYLGADLYVGAVGYSMWERASLLLPSFVSPISDNQIPYAQTGEELGIHKIVLDSLGDTWSSDAFAMQSAAADLEMGCSAYKFLFV